MKTSVVLRALLAAVILLPFAGPSMTQAEAQENGIFADFTTTLGSFTCRLEYTAAPQAVANFIGLATGEKAWLDERSGRVRTNAFYDGLTFHRVIAGFMIQGGSPNGQGTDGPGYVFPDEFNPALRHDGPGVLSSANSGPDSNGAQFFITVTNTPWLDGVHTVFGRVISGQNVVQAINQVATDANDKPLTPVIVQRVVIRRVGAAAQAFDLRAQNLPTVTAVPLGIARGNGQVSLTYTNRPYTDNQLYESGNLLHWTNLNLGIDLAAPVASQVNRAAGGRARFFSLAQVQYPSSTLAPRTVRNRTLSLAFDGIATMTIQFNAAGGGNYTFGVNTGTVVAYTWEQEVYRGRLWPIYFSGVFPMTLRLDFTSESGGTFVGTVYIDPPKPPLGVTGEFTISNP